MVVDVDFTVSDADAGFTGAGQGRGHGWWYVIMMFNVRRSTNLLLPLVITVYRDAPPLYCDSYSTKPVSDLTPSFSQSKSPQLGSLFVALHVLQRLAQVRCDSHRNEMYCGLSTEHRLSRFNLCAM